MKTFESKFGINDVVWRADSYGYERDIVQAVKFDAKPQYRFKQTKGYGLLGGLMGSTENWVNEAAVFEDEEAACTYHEKLKVKRERKAQNRLNEENQRRVIKLKAELAAAEAGIELVEDDDYE